MDKSKAKVASIAPVSTEPRGLNLAQQYFYCQINDRQFIIFEKSTYSKERMNFIASTRSEVQAKSLVHKLNVSASV